MPDRLKGHNSPTTRTCAFRREPEVGGVGAGQLCGHKGHCCCRPSPEHKKEGAEADSAVMCQEKTRQKKEEQEEEEKEDTSPSKPPRRSQRQSRTHVNLLSLQLITRLCVVSHIACIIDFTSVWVCFQWERILIIE